MGVNQRIGLISFRSACLLEIPVIRTERNSRFVPCREGSEAPRLPRFKYDKVLWVADQDAP